MKINWGGGLCIEYKVTLLFYKNAVNYKYMYNFVYLFFLTSLVLLHQITVHWDEYSNHKKDFHFTRDLKNIFNNSHDVNLH